jgi:hypothetical protein
MTTISVKSPNVDGKYTVELTLLMTNKVSTYCQKTVLEGVLSDRNNSWIIGPHPCLLRIYITDIYVFIDAESYKFRFDPQQHDANISIVIDKHNVKIDNILPQRTVVASNGIWCCSPKYVLDHVVD